MSDEAVVKATGQNWTTWCQRLDAAGAADLPHKEIALILHQKFHVRPWWAQMVTVGYEQSIGRRIVGQSCAGKFNANASKTLPASAAITHAWFADAKKRARWLDRKITLRKATAPKSARFGFSDGSIAGVAITPKGAAKCIIGVSHDGFATAAAANRHRKFWRGALDDLADKIST